MDVMSAAHSDQSTPSAAESLLLAEEAAEAIQRRGLARTTQELDLANGLTGTAIFLATLSKYSSRGREWANLATQCGQRVVDELPRQMVRNPGLFSGIAGIAWGLRYLGELLHIDGLYADETYQDIPQLCVAYWKSRSDCDYDLISGSVGVGIWALSIADRSIREELTGHALEHLEKTAEALSTGIAWRTPLSRLRRMKPENQRRGPVQYDLGIAHGMPGAIGFLARCVELDVCKHRASALLAASTEWLLSQALTDSTSVSCFSFNATQPQPARLAWCYGDLGIALALDHAARALNSTSVHGFAERVAKAAAARRSENAGVIDAGICHGAAGLAHGFAKLNRRLNMPSLEGARLYWLRALLGFRTGTGEIVSYPCWDGITESMSVANGGLLNGLAGIGLVFLSQSCPELKWDWPFLM
jgi:lantibiotic modifying enzyme